MCPDTFISLQVGTVIRCRHPAARESTLLHIASPGKDRNPKIKVWFLVNTCHFCTIVKQKNHKVNLPKWGPSVLPGEWPLLVPDEAEERTQSPLLPSDGACLGGPHQTQVLRDHG